MLIGIGGVISLDVLRLQPEEVPFDGELPPHLSLSDGSKGKAGRRAGQSLPLIHNSFPVICIWSMSLVRASLEYLLTVWRRVSFPLLLFVWLCSVYGLGASRLPTPPAIDAFHHQSARWLSQQTSRKHWRFQDIFRPALLLNTSRRARTERPSSPSSSLGFWPFYWPFCVSTHEQSS